MMDQLGNSYQYDAENRLTEFTQAPSLGGGATSYQYDESGKRIRRSVNGGAPIEYVYDSQGRHIGDSTSSGIVTLAEVYAGARHLSSYAGGNLYFNHSDWLGTERARSLYNGTPYETCSSLPYGDGLSCTASDISQMHFTGKERDAESGNDYFGARYYSSNVGRFMSADPGPYVKTDPQTWNRCTYARNNALSLVDPTGNYFVVAPGLQQQVQQSISTLLRSPQGAATINAIASSKLPVTFGMGTLPVSSNNDGTMNVTAGNTSVAAGNTPGAIGGASVLLDNSNISRIADASGTSVFTAGLKTFAHEDQHVTDILSAPTYQAAAAANAAGDAAGIHDGSTTGGTAESRAGQIISSLGPAGQAFEPDSQYDTAAANILQQGAAQQLAAEQAAAAQAAHTAYCSVATLYGICP